MESNFMDYLKKEIENEDDPHLRMMTAFLGSKSMEDEIIDTCRKRIDGMAKRIKERVRYIFEECKRELRREKKDYRKYISESDGAEKVTFVKAVQLHMDAIQCQIRYLTLLENKLEGLDTKTVVNDFILFGLENATIYKSISDYEKMYAIKAVAKNCTVEDFEEKPRKFGYNSIEDAEGCIEYHKKFNEKEPYEKIYDLVYDEEMAKFFNGVGLTIEDLYRVI